MQVILLILFIIYYQYVARLEAEFMESNKKSEAELLESKQHIAELLESKQRLDCNNIYIQFLIFTLMPILLFPVFYEWKAKGFDAQSFSNAIIACKWMKDLDEHYIEDYRANRSSREPNGGNTATGTRYQGGSLQCSAFRQIKMQQDEYKLSSWTIDPEPLQEIILKDLFDSDTKRFNTFIDDQINKLEQFRKYFFSYISITQGAIDEETVFQPIFQIFLKGFLGALNQDEDARHLENLMANGDTFETYRTNKFGDVIRLSGRTDVTVYLSSTLSKKPINSICHIELRSPYEKLHQSDSLSSIDQLMAETDCISSMRNLNSAVGRTTTTLGALTDMFSINLMYHNRRDNNREFFATTKILEPRGYIRSLLTLCLSATAIATITSTVPEEAAAVVENSLSAALSGDVDDDGDDFYEYDGAQDDRDNGGESRRKKAKRGSSHGEEDGMHIYEINFNDEDERDAWENKLTFLRQCENRRQGVTLTIANIIAHGGDPTRYY